MTPLTLAMLCIALVILPFIVGAIGLGLSKLLGCEINEAGTTKCYLLGIDVSNVLYFLMMFNIFGMMAGIVAIFGLIISAIWGVFSLIF